MKIGDRYERYKECRQDWFGWEKNIRGVTQLQGMEYKHLEGLRLRVLQEAVQE